MYYTHEILKNVHFESHLRLVPEIAASHHEKVDGSGYHRGLKGNEILLSGRILAISDVFDAVTSRRHYRNRMPFNRVLSILKKDADTHFDKDCIDSFFQIRLIDVARILAFDNISTLDDLDQDTKLILTRLDSMITLAEYENIMSLEHKTKGQMDIDDIFNSLYHRVELDNKMD